jgi:hypothetical protein
LAATHQANVAEVVATISLNRLDFRGIVRGYLAWHHSNKSAASTRSELISSNGRTLIHAWPIYLVWTNRFHQRGRHSQAAEAAAVARVPTHLEGLHAFVGSDQQRVAVFVGRGGIGKTKHTALT